MVTNTNFNNSGLGNSDIKTTEKIHYLGELRIVGQVVNRLEDKEPIGYVVMTERTQKFKMYTVNQTTSLLNKFKFVNAEIRDGKIVNTECAMTRMPKYSVNMRVIGNPGIIVLGEIIDGDKLIGYRALDCNGTIADLDESELITLNNNGIEVINAKVVNKNKSSYISAIKGEFTKIEKSKLKDLRGAESAGSKWRKQKHVDKWLNYIGLRIMRYTFIGYGEIINDSIMARYPENYNIYGSYLDLNREAKILAKEVFIPKNGITLSENDKEKFTKIIKEVPHSSVLGYTKDKRYANPTDKDKLFIALIAQFILNNEELRNKFIKQMVDGRYRGNRFTSTVYNSPYASNTFKETYIKINKLIKDKEVEIQNKWKEVSEEDKKKMFKTTTFTSAQDIAQLGFAISKQNKDFDFETKYGFKKTLLYLGDIIEEDYEVYRDKSRCLGDLISIAYIEKLTNKFYSYNMKREKIIAAIEMIIAIAYLFDSEAMREYVERNEYKLTGLGISIPDYEDIVGVDYKLPNELKMYYSSGFNVFLNDNEYLPKAYRSNYLRHAELINYRQLGIIHNIKHPILTNDLAPIVNMITSDNCDANLVDEMIGQIRFL